MNKPVLMILTCQSCTVVPTSRTAQKNTSQVVQFSREAPCRRQICRSSMKAGGAAFHRKNGRSVWASGKQTTPILNSLLTFTNLGCTRQTIMKMFGLIELPLTVDVATEGRCQRCWRGGRKTRMDGLSMNVYHSSHSPRPWRLSYQPQFYTTLYAV
ncbi:hypothetical protein UPYG_G00225950 [Umbra pygmaea]|uniref:Secreted protein n=1 Tax=Umbra pygmaea TaxID=75934 RepID=A0ABD0WHS7_UMBPY